MDAGRLFDRYRELQSYIGWTEQDASRVAAVAALLDPHLPALIDDFYAQIERHPGTLAVITGGQAQIERLKGSLRQWVRELLAGPYDEAYVQRRWRVGRRHVEIGLDQVYTSVAMSRLQTGLCLVLREDAGASAERLQDTIGSLNRLLDLDLAIIQEAYQAEFTSRLQRNERLANLGQIAGGIAHELRNPLNVVKTSVYYILNARSPSPEKQAEHLRRIDRQVDLANGVIATLSNFARMPLPALQPTPIEPCLRSVLEEFARDDGVRVEIDLPASLPPTLADANQLRIVFSNLIRNARDSMTQGGLLTIRGDLVDEAVEVAVADTGVGIPETDFPKIQEPLYSTKARGIGLGLAIVRSILDKCGGHLRLESTVGRGSTFTVRLPVSPVARRAEESEAPLEIACMVNRNDESDA